MSQENGLPPSEQHPLLRALMPEVDTTESVVDIHAESEDPKPHPLSGFAHTARPHGVWPRVWMELYLIAYGLGAFTRGVWHALVELLIHLLTPPARALARLWERTAVKQWQRLLFELRRVRHGFTLAQERVVQAKDRHRLLAVLQVLVLPFMAIRRHRRLSSLLIQSAMVLGSVLVLTVVVRYWQNTTFALELVYGGERIGYIEDESVFKQAVDMAESRIVREADSAILERESYLTLRPTQQNRVLNETELCDAILEMCGSEVEEMSGLYVDGVFEGALPVRDQMERLLKEVLAFYEPESETLNQKIEFQNRIEIVDGLYPVGSDEPYRDLFKRLTAVDAEGVPFLRVQVRSTEVYTEVIAFEKRTVKDNTKPNWYSEVVTKGVNGEREITADVIRINGEEQYREILSSEVVKEAVTEVTVVGTRKVVNAQPGVPTGQFLWPLPSCRILNSEFGYRWGKLHAGIDISGNGVLNKPIIASDGGVVKQVNAEGWGGGYGLYVIIDHGDGYTTSYCHCNEILVKVGDKVAQGDVIAKVGNTGNSFGPHLHFEVRVNGTAVDPAPLLK